MGRLKISLPPRSRSVLFFLTASLFLFLVNQSESYGESENGTVEGWMSYNGSVMELKTVGATWTPKRNMLTLWFYPVELTANEVETILIGRSLGPLTNRMKTVPGSANMFTSNFTLRLHPGATTLSTSAIAQYGVTMFRYGNIRDGSSLWPSLKNGGAHFNIVKGELRQGSVVDVTSNGTDVVNNKTIAWDFKVRVTILGQF